LPPVSFTKSTVSTDTSALADMVLDVLVKML
jgi:hypothetical protein